MTAALAVLVGASVYLASFIETKVLEMEKESELKRRKMGQEYEQSVQNNIMHWQDAEKYRQ